MFHFCLRLELPILVMVYWILLVPSFVAGVNCETEAIIKDYFLHGPSYKEILEFLEIFYPVLAPATSDLEKAELIS